MRQKPLLTRLALGLFFILNFTFLLPAPAHAQFQILPSPTGSCPTFPVYGQKEVETTDKNGQKIKKIEKGIKQIVMACKAGMCHRCPWSGKLDDPAAKECAKGDATILTDIPCNYSVDDILNTVLNVVRLIFALTGAVALAMFIWGGVYYFILSQGESDKIKKGKALILNSVIAICIIFGAGVIVTFVTQSLGARFDTDEPYTDTISTGSVSCPRGGRDGEKCLGQESTNMVCDYGRDVASGAVSTTEGKCVTLCEYNATPPDQILENDTNGAYQCVDTGTNFNLVTPAQKRTCQTDMCPGGATVQCCKL